MVSAFQCATTAAAAAVVIIKVGLNSCSMVFGHDEGARIKWPVCIESLQQKTALNNSVDDPACYILPSYRKILFAF